MPLFLFIVLSSHCLFLIQMISIYLQIYITKRPSDDNDIVIITTPCMIAMICDLCIALSHIFVFFFFLILIFFSKCVFSFAYFSIITSYSSGLRSGGGGGSGSGVCVVPCIIYNSSHYHHHHHRLLRRCRPNRSSKRTIQAKSVYVSGLLFTLTLLACNMITQSLHYIPL